MKKVSTGQRVDIKDIRRGIDALRFRDDNDIAGEQMFVEELMDTTPVSSFESDSWRDGYIPENHRSAPEDAVEHRFNSNNGYGSDTDTVERIILGREAFEHVRGSSLFVKEEVVKVDDREEATGLLSDALAAADEKRATRMNDRDGGGGGGGGCGNGSSSSNNSCSNTCNGCVSGIGLGIGAAGGASAGMNSVGGGGIGGQITMGGGGGIGGSGMPAMAQGGRQQGSRTHTPTTSSASTMWPPLSTDSISPLPHRRSISSASDSEGGGGGGGGGRQVSGSGGDEVGEAGTASSVIGLLLKEKVIKDMGLSPSPGQYGLRIAEDDGEPDLDVPELDSFAKILNVGVDLFVLCPAGGVEGLIEVSVCLSEDDDEIESAGAVAAGGGGGGGGGGGCASSTHQDCQTLKVEYRALRGRDTNLHVIFMSLSPVGPPTSSPSPSSLMESNSSHAGGGGGGIYGGGNRGRRGSNGS